MEEWMDVWIDVARHPGHDARSGDVKRHRVDQPPRLAWHPACVYGDRHCSSGLFWSIRDHDGRPRKRLPFSKLP
jgi:hypothetical protein